MESITLVHNFKICIQFLDSFILSLKCIKCTFNVKSYKRPIGLLLHAHIWYLDITMSTMCCWYFVIDNIYWSTYRAIFKRWDSRFKHITSRGDFLFGSKKIICWMQFTRLFVFLLLKKYRRVFCLVLNVFLDYFVFV